MDWRTKSFNKAKGSVGLRGEDHWSRAISSPGSSKVLQDATEIGHKYNFQCTEQMFRKSEHKLTGQIHRRISLLPTGKYEESNLFSIHSFLLHLHFQKLSKDVVFYDLGLFIT